MLHFGSLVQILKTLENKKRFFDLKFIILRVLMLQKPHQI